MAAGFGQLNKTGKERIVCSVIPHGQGLLENQSDNHAKMPAPRK